MKKLFFMVLVSLNSHFSSAQTNVYHPFPDSNAVWTISYYMNNTMCTDFGYYQYSMGGDTTIGAFVYQKIIMNFISCFSCCAATVPGIRGFIRQDTSLKKLYLYNSVSTDDLLYDFSLNVGDTMNGPFICGPYGIVASIDSILVGNQYRRKINLVQPLCNPDTAFLIEGIGSNFGFLESFASWGEWASCLACFKTGNDTLSVLPPSLCYECSDVPTNVGEIGASDNFKIYPNPFNGHFTISSPDISFETELTLTDVIGQIIYETKIFPPIRSKTIYLPEIQNGIYLLKIKMKDKVVVKKILRLLND